MQVQCLLLWLLVTNHSIKFHRVLKTYFSQIQHLRSLFHLAFLAVTYNDDGLCSCKGKAACDVGDLDWSVTALLWRIWPSFLPIQQTPFACFLGLKVEASSNAHHLSACCPTERRLLPQPQATESWQTLWTFSHKLPLTTSHLKHIHNFETISFWW